MPQPRFIAREGGQSVVIVALIFVLLMGFAAASVDAGRFYAERRFLQSAMDAAALACAKAYADSGQATTGWNAANALLQDRYLGVNPLGLTASAVRPAAFGAEQYDNGIVTPLRLSSGILPNSASPLGCRVATTVDVPTYFMKLLTPGLAKITTTVRAYAESGGGMLPVVVNRYRDPPGPSSTFLDYTKQEAFQLANPNVCSQDNPAACPDPQKSPLGCTSGCLWGAETVVVGSGYSSSDSDFRGFIALDIRDFTAVDPGTGNPIHQYYNETAGLNTNQLKAKESSYVSEGSYPGPNLVPYVAGASPVQADLQVAAMSGNSTGIVVDDFNQHYKLGDFILTQVFDGQVRTIPDFTVPQLTSIPANSPSGPANGPTFRVGANQTFRDNLNTVTLAFQADTYNGTATDTPAQLHPFTFTPNNFTPAGGTGTTVTINNLQVDAGLATGIYSVIITGTGYDAGGTQLATHQVYVPLNIGGVTRDFSLDFAANSVDIAVADPTATFTGALNTGSGAAGWGTNSVSMALDTGTCPAGNVRLMKQGMQTCVSATVTPGSAVPDKTSPPSVNVTFQTAGLAAGAYSAVIRARGTNQSGQPVVHVAPLQINVGSTGGASRSYVNVQGYVVFMITSMTANTIYGRAVSATVADWHDLTAALGTRIRLVPWETTP